MGQDAMRFKTSCDTHAAAEPEAMGYGWEPPPQSAGGLGQSAAPCGQGQPVARSSR